MCDEKWAYLSSSDAGCLMLPNPNCARSRVYLSSAPVQSRIPRAGLALFSRFAFPKWKHNLKCLYAACVALTARLTQGIEAAKVWLLPQHSQTTERGRAYVSFSVPWPDQSRFGGHPVAHCNESGDAATAEQRRDKTGIEVTGRGDGTIADTPTDNSGDAQTDSSRRNENANS